MLYKKLLSLMMLFCFSINAIDLLTVALHREMEESNMENISAETHPILYGLVKEIASKANIEMPKYITIARAKNELVVDEHGYIHENPGKMVSKSTFFGDLYISRQLLEHASYEEAKGIIAVALANKSLHAPQIKALGFIATFALSAGALIYLFKHYEFLAHDNQEDRDFKAQLIMLSSILSTIIGCKMIENNLQKKIDLRAVKLSGKKIIKKSLERIDKVQKAYFQENFVDRAVSALGLTNFFNILFYPIRAYTLEERLEYIEKVL